VFVCMCVYIKNMGSWAHMSSVQCVCTHVYVCACVCVCGVCVCAQHVTTQASSHDKETNNDATATDEVRLAVWLLSSSQRRKTPTISRENGPLYNVHCTLYHVRLYEAAWSAAYSVLRHTLICGIVLRPVVVCSGPAVSSDPNLPRP
jgi:hypothetical protein